MGSKPLRLKLVASVLVLVTAALAVIGVASAFAMRDYLLGQIDGELFDTARTVNVASLPPHQQTTVFLPTDYVAREQNDHGIGPDPWADTSLRPEDLPQMPATPKEIAAHLNQPYTKWALNGTRRWRLLVTQLPNGLYLVIGQNQTDVDNAVDRLIAIELVVGVTVLTVLAGLGVAMVRASLRPLVEIEHTAAAIADGDLARRVPQHDPGTELGRLAQALNAMLAQIEGAFTARAASEQAAREAEAAAKRSERRAVRSEERMRQFVADASHELRTPLTTIRGFAELYRQGAVREPEQIQALLKRIEDEAARMGLLVEDLLLLARLDQERPLVLAPVDLRTVAADAIGAARAIAPDRPIRLELPPDGRVPVVIGDESRLRQVVGNLMTNALTHTPPDSAVTLRLSTADGQATVEVVDHGPGLSAEQAERVFERFYRVDKARTRQAAGAAGSRHSGSGLGLAIVAALVGAHEGTVEVDTTAGGGATFRVRLPLAEKDVEVLPESSQPEPSSTAVSAGTVDA